MKGRNPTDYKISCLTDFDLRQYQFSRNSGLPRGYFDRRQISFWHAFEVAGMSVFGAAFLCFVLFS